MSTQRAAELCAHASRIGVRGLADAVGVTPGRVSRVLSGQESITAATLDAWCLAARAVHPDPDATIQPNFGEHGSGVRVRRARTDPRPEILTALTAEQEAALGTRPDPELAAEWGIGAGVVFRARHRLGIPAFKYR